MSTIHPPYLQHLRNSINKSPSVSSTVSCSTSTLSALRTLPRRNPQQQHQTRAVATTRRFTKANRAAPSATATPTSKYLSPSSRINNNSNTNNRNAGSNSSRIIFHPPPSVPSPYHTPPLFLPSSDPRKTLLAQSHSFNNPYASGARPLPPPVRTGELPAAEKKYHLTEADITEIRRLRKEDPWQWTVPKLAEKFGCSKIFIGIAAPASEERKEWGLALHQRFRDRWGRKRNAAVEARHKRRELWERDL